MKSNINSRSTPHASVIKTRCFQAGLILETSGPNDEVLKFLPPLTVTDDVWDRAIGIVEDVTNEVMNT